MKLVKQSMKLVKQNMKLVTTDLQNLGDPRFDSNVVGCCLVSTRKQLSKFR